MQQEIVHLRSQIVSLQQENNSLSIKVSTLMDKHPRISVLTEENTLLEEKVEILSNENKSLKYNLETNNQSLNLSKKNNKSLQDRIVDLTRELKNKHFKADVPDIWESVPRLQTALLDTSYKLGVATSQIVFLRNQLKKDSLQIYQQIKIVNASQKKEDLTNLHCKEKIRKINEKHIKLKSWYNQVDTDLNNQVHETMDENILLREDNQYKLQTDRKIK